MTPGGPWVDGGNSSHQLAGPFIARQLLTGWWDVIDTGQHRVRAVFPTLDDAARHARFLVRYERNERRSVAAMQSRSREDLISDIRNLMQPVRELLDSLPDWLFASDEATADARAAVDELLRRASL